MRKFFQMQGLKNWPLQARSRITGVLTDIDDTLTTAGAITPDALAALAALKAAGLSVIAVTGRPVDWSEPFALDWPVDAIVAENGAAALLPYKKCLSRISGGQTMLSKMYHQDAQTCAGNFDRLQSVLEHIERELPGVHRATDSAGRETDIAIDRSEFAHLSQAQIAAVVTLMNEIERWVYVGDSSNDQLMFEAFNNSVGVANLLRFEAQLSHKPRYITQGECGR